MDLDSTQEVHLSHYWNIIRKRWKVAAAIFLTVMAATYIISQLAKPLYRATVVLQIERENPNRLTVEDLFGIEPSSQEFLQTQYALIKSRALAERVIDDLHLMSDPEFNPAGVIGKSPEELRNMKSGFVGQIAGNVSVNPVQWTSLVEVGYVATSPRLAQKVANGLGESFITMNIERNHTAVRETNNFLTSQIEELKQQVTESEKELQKYGESKDIVSVGDAGGGNIVLTKLADLTRAYSAAQGDRLQKQVAWETLRTASPESLPTIMNDPLVVQQRAKLGDLQNSYAQKLGTFKPEHPEMVNIRAQIEKTRQAVSEAIQEAMQKARDTARVAYEQAAAQERSLEAALQTQKREAMTLNANAVGYVNLQANIDTKRQLLEQLSKKLSETEVTTRLRGGDDSNIRVVDRAEVPGARFNESLNKNMKSAVPLGLVLGLATVFFLEYLDRSLKSPEEVEQITGFASLGVIPSAGSTGKGPTYGGYGGYGGYGYGKLRPVDTGESEPESIDLLPHTNSRSPISEAYRAFRTALLLSSAKSPRVMVITSTSPREGKTTTAVNTAVVLAQMGQPVVIVDGDLRKPRLHKVFKGSRNDGLVNHLATNAPIDQILQKTPVPNLFLIASGPIPPNPSELLASDKMKNLVAQLRSKFAYVIIDSPPLLAVTDSIVLSPTADGVVLCVHGGETPKELVKRGADRLKQANITVLGTLLNNLDIHQHGYTYAKSYYSYYEETPPVPEKGGVLKRLRSRGKKAV